MSVGKFGDDGEWEKENCRSSSSSLHLPRKKQDMKKLEDWLWGGRCYRCLMMEELNLSQILIGYGWSKIGMRKSISGKEVEWISCWSQLRHQ